MEFFWNLPHRTQKEYIERELSEFEWANNLHEIFQRSIDAIQDKVKDAEDFSDATELAYQQLQEIQDLYDLFQNEYLSHSFTRTWNLEVWESFRSIIWLIEQGNNLDWMSDLIESRIDWELDRLADTFMSSTFRDKVESSVDFKWWGLRETYNETREMTIFLDAFTIEYINFLESREWRKIDAEEIWSELELDPNELDAVLSNALSRIFNSNIENYASISAFTVGFILSEYWERQIDFSDYPQTPIIDSNESSPDSIEDIITDEDMWAPNISESPETLISPEDPREFFEDIDDVSYDRVLEWYYQWAYSHSDVMSYFEWDSWFQRDKNNGYSYWDALRDVGFSDSLQEDINTIFWRELSQTEVQNLLNMTRYVLYIESSWWYNVANYEWVSTAKWYFQYLTWNWVYLREIMQDGNWTQWGDWSWEHNESATVRRVWWTNSYETALTQIPESIQMRNEFQTEIEKRWNQEIQDPRALSAENQTILFLSDLRERPWAESHITKMFQWDIEAVEELYRLHHTDTDASTELLMLLAGRDIYGKEIEVYTGTPGSEVQGLILPGTGQAEFFMNLIKIFNPNTSLSQSDVMNSLMKLWDISFPAGWRVGISRTTEEGIAYNLTLNGNDYLKIDNQWEFINVR